ncbi:MAG: gliding motility-associated C-terminal domain-containing protein [Tenacibaculum sp.]
MRFFFTLILITIPIFVIGQVAFYNYGELKLHDEASIGFHTDFINDGNLDNNNRGLAGFYNSDDEIINVSGKNKAVFYDLDIDAIGDVNLNTSVGVSNNMSFVNGKVYTPREDTSISLHFINSNLYVGEDNLRFVDGCVSETGLSSFKFPVGDNNKLRPLHISTKTPTDTYTVAYYFSNPNSPPISFAESFLTSKKQVLIDKISSVEFWYLDGNLKATATLTWDADSEINSINSNIELLRVVGWSKAESKWVNLGKSKVSGTANSGELTSNAFIPNKYTIITIGSEFSEDELGSTNLIITPNGDGLNEALTFKNLDAYTSNKLSIYNRYGNKIFETNDYKNDWSGVSEGRITVAKQTNLPAGTYFYILELKNKDSSKTQNGWLYINK